MCGEREREGERQTDRQTDRQTETETDRDRQTDRQTDRQRRRKSFAGVSVALVDGGKILHRSLWRNLFATSADDRKLWGKLVTESFVTSLVNEKHALRQLMSESLCGFS